MHFSFRQKADFIISIIIVAFYLINQQVKNLVRVPYIGYFLRCHFNDLMAAILFLAYINLILSISKFQTCIKNFSWILSFSCLCSIFWEGIAPLFIKNSVADIWDVLFYILGGFIYWYYIRVAERFDY